MIELVKHALKNRYSQTIAVGKLIGATVFPVCGSALGTGGPAALLVDYCITDFMLFNVCLVPGELSVIFPTSGPLTVYFSR